MKFLTSYILKQDYNTPEFSFPKGTQVKSFGVMGAIPGIGDGFVIIFPNGVNKVYDKDSIQNFDDWFEEDPNVECGCGGTCGVNHES
jgi:hypothetical protein